MRFLMMEEFWTERFEYCPGNLETHSNYINILYNALGTGLYEIVSNYS